MIALAALAQVRGVTQASGSSHIVPVRPNVGAPLLVREPSLLAGGTDAGRDPARGVQRKRFGAGPTASGALIFMPAVTYSASGPAESIAVADVNGDGKPDLVVANLCLAKPHCVNIDGVVGVLLGNGDGTFQSPRGYLTGTNPVAVAVADVNGDGKVDLIVANVGSDTLSVLINNGTGGFALALTLSVGSGPRWVIAADVSGDGKTDLICANYGTNTLTVLVQSPTFNGGFIGNGAWLTSINAANIGSGTLADARLSANVARLNVNQTFTGRNTFASTLLGSSGGGISQPQLRGEQTNPGDFARLRLGVVGSPQWDISVSPGATPDLRFWNGSADKMILGYDGNLSFGMQVRQMLNLWGTQYGIGVQSSTVYFRTDNASGSANGFAWYKGGTHDDRMQNAGGGATLMTLTSTGLVVNGTVITSSDRNLKAGFEQVDAQATLEKVAALAITRWHYTNDAATAHVGPMAQDFHASFGVGSDDKHIATVDADGVALAAIQGLNQKLEEALKVKDAELKALQERFSRLEAAVERRIRKTE